MKCDYFDDLAVPGVPDAPGLDRGRCKPRHDADVPAVPTVPGENEGQDGLEALPLAAKLRAYGEPFPLMVGDRVAAWLAPDDEAAKAADKSEPVYTAEEVKVVAELSPEEAQRLHDLKARLGGRITRDQLAQEEAQ